MSLDGILCLLKEFFYWCLDQLINLLEVIISFLLLFLPTTPFQFEKLEWGDFGQLIGYVIPIVTILQHFVTILLCIAVYYGVRHLLRLVRMVK